MLHPLADYVLGSGPQEVERLQLQARTWMPETETFLDQIGIQPGWRCLDIGCGSMGILQPLSQRAGPSGSVVGVDIDPIQLAAARVFLQQEALGNVTLLEQDAFHPSFAAQTFDFIHIRLFFTAPDARTLDLLGTLLDRTRSGGVLAVQEPVCAPWDCYPSHWAWQRLKERILALFTQWGIDNAIGQAMPALLRQAGWDRVQVRPTLLALQKGHPYMRLPLLLAAQLRQPLLDAGFFTASELVETLEAYETFIARPDVMMTTFLLLQTWGYKC